MTTQENAGKPRTVSKGHKPSAPTWFLRIVGFSVRTLSRVLPIKLVVFQIRSFLTAIGSAHALLWKGLLSTNTPAEHQKIRKLLQQVHRFTQQEGIAAAMDRALTTRLFRNLAMLRRVQDKLCGWSDGADRIDYCAITAEQPSLPDGEKIVLPSHSVAWRFMRFATAAYGQFACGQVANSMGRIYDSVLEKVIRDITTLEVEDILVAHIGIQREDFVHHECSFGGSIEYPRHFVAVDHEQKAVVLAIRGTFSYADAVADVMGMTAPFCGGYAHKGISELAVALWNAIGGLVKDVLFNEMPDDYGFVLVGHSLGAGVASLLMVYLHHMQDEIVKSGRKVRCFAYASPPVFGPRSAIPTQVLQSTFHYLYGNDLVPFISVHNARKFLTVLNRIDQYLNGMPRLVGISHAFGFRPIPNALCESLEPLLCSRRQSIKRLSILIEKLKDDEEEDEAEDKSSVLVVPSACYVWIEEERCSEKTNGRSRMRQVSCDVDKVACMGIYADTSMVNDHSGSAYEIGLKSLMSVSPRKDKAE